MFILKLFWLEVKLMIMLFFIICIVVIVMVLVWVGLIFLGMIDELGLLVGMFNLL